MTSGPVVVKRFSAESDLRGFAESFGGCLLGGEVLALTGELGAGKTAFTQGLARGLGVPARLAVTSPTFVLHRHYPGRVPLDHLDAYRLSSVLDLEALGIGEILDGPSVTVVEWADKVAPVFPPRTFWIHIDIIDLSERDMRIQCPKERFLSPDVLLNLKKIKFLSL